jgi:Major capsid protein Gp23
MLIEELIKKWGPVLEHEELAPIRDIHRRNVVAQLLENTEREGRVAGAHGNYNLLAEAMTSSLPVNKMAASSSTAGDGAIDTFDPVMINLVRRAMPNLIPYDVCGVQAMTGPTGLIFAMRSRYTNQAGDEAFYNEPNTSFSSVVGGNNTLGQLHVGTVPNTAYNGNTYNTGSAMSRAQGEALGTEANVAFPQMAFSIEKVTVTANTRALKAEYTMELAQDLKAVHGLDAETELSNILSAEIIAEINREVIRTINLTSKVGAQGSTTTTAGVFDLDTDSNGRWSVEKFKGLMFHLDREANVIAKETRRGKGNILICSADVASALQMAGVLDYTPALNGNNLQVDDTGNTFAGILNGRYKVFIDPYAIGGNYFTLGYRGSNAFDAGLFYCPYVPLQMVRAVDQDSFQPKIGFKTRYGMVANPFAGGTSAQNGVLTVDSNVYYRRVQVTNIL